MKYIEFSERYDLEVPRLIAACSLLENKLKHVLKDLLEKEFFRIRVTEARVKDKDSLYDKLNEDNINVRDAFDVAGKIRDLLGARIVCHNIDDIGRIINAIEDANETFTLKRPNRGKEKRWVEKAQEDFGYRGHHVDVLFEQDGSPFQAELQVRTILQDAWATFMHHDVYKGPIKRIVKQDIAGLPMSVSDLFYGLDQMSQSLRNYVEKNPISPDVKIKRIDALQHKMFSFIEFHRSAGSLPNYSQVERIDRYHIKNNKVTFKHSIKAEAETAIPFEFLLGGDSGVLYLDIHSLTDCRDPESPKKVEYRVKNISETMVALWKKPKTRSKYHHYKVECEWLNIFEQEMDYIFSPWGRYYHGAKVNYVLEVECKDNFARPPRCYMLDLKKNTNLNSLFKNFGTVSDVGLEMNYDGEKNIYRLEFPGLEDTVLCLMHFKKRWHVDE